jgi:hypothetical protein
MKNSSDKRVTWCVLALATASLAAGVLLSRWIEPGVRVESVTLAGVTPALHFYPAGAGPHPVALLAHGITSSKEMLFRCSEALAAAGFECYSVDLPGHGASAQAFTFDRTLKALGKVTPVIGPVDVFVGHSMGVYAGAAAVSDGGLNPRLFVAIGSVPDLGPHGPPLLLLAGRFEEFPQILPAMKARADARVVISPWCDHALEPWDPKLVNTAVQAACAATGRTPPPPPTRWRWRLVGIVLGFWGAVGLGVRLPEIFPSLAKWPGVPLSLLVIVSSALTCKTWLAAMPYLGRVPLVIGAAALTWLAIAVAARWRIPRWTLPASAMGASLVCGVLGLWLTPWFSLGALLAGGLAACLWMGLLLGAIVGRRSRQGGLAMAIFVGYVIGQWLPKFI